MGSKLMLELNLSAQIDRKDDRVVKMSDLSPDGDKPRGFEPHSFQSLIFLNPSELHKFRCTTYFLRTPV